jgi:hypothetical protein
MPSPVAAAHSFASDRRVLALETGYVGNAPEQTEIGDEVVVLYGTKAPLVIRKVDESIYTILGPAYVCGMMKGQFLALDLQPQTFKFM